MKTFMLSLVLMVGMSSLCMTGCVVHDRDRVVYDRDHPRYDHDREVVHEHDETVHGDVHVDVRP